MKVDTDVILAKVDIVRRCLRAIREVAPTSAALDDWKAQDIVVLNLQRVIQALVDCAQHALAENDRGLPRSSYDAISLVGQAGWLTREQQEVMRKAIGFRNIAVHAYTELDLEVVRTIVRDGLAALEAVAEAWLALLRANP